MSAPHLLDIDLTSADVQHVSKSPRLFSAEAKGMQLADFTDPLPTLLSLDPPQDVRRDPNQHVAFGFGEHFCLGAALELAGEPARLRSGELDAWKRMPVRLRERRP